VNTNLLNIVKRIINDYGEAILADPVRLKPLFSDYAKNEFKEDRVAFGRCIEMGFYNELKRTQTGDERQRLKTTLANKLQAKTGIDKPHCNDALDLLETAIFGEQNYQKIYCKNCGEELQNNWVTCPYCLQPAAKITSGSGRVNSVPYLSPQNYTPVSPAPYNINISVPPYMSQNNTPVRKKGLWTAVLIFNIIGLNWVSRFITGHIVTGILVLLIDIASLATLASIGETGLIILIIGLIIWVVDLIRIGSGKWLCSDGTFLT
jgi:hypothetical protein